MRIQRLFFVCILLFSAAACSEVVSVFPVGEKSVSLKPEEWNGKWVAVPSDKEYAILEVLPGQEGMLRITGHSNGTDDKPMDAILRTSDGWMFVNVAKEDNSGYYWARIRNQDGRAIFVWLPSFDKCKGLIEKGTLSGEVNGSSISLNLARPEHLKIITSEEYGVIFDWDEPAVLRKVDGKIKR
jgi:hypothetical protein